MKKPENNSADFVSFVLSLSKNTKLRTTAMATSKKIVMELIHRGEFGA
jgi:hypothetical protein